MTIASRIPLTHTAYTLAEMLNNLKLDDSPCLTFVIDGKENVVQHSHITQEQLLAAPGWAESQWRYITTTHEWIPIFVFAENQDIHALVDTAPVVDWDGQPDPDLDHMLWVTPKAFPRKQYGEK